MKIWVKLQQYGENGKDKDTEKTKDKDKDREKVTNGEKKNEKESKDKAPKKSVLIPIEIDHTKTIAYLKEIIETLTGLDPIRQIIVYKGQIIPNHERIVDTAIQPNHWVVVFGKEHEEQPKQPSPPRSQTSMEPTRFRLPSAEAMIAQLHRYIDPNLTQRLVDMGFQQNHVIKALLLNLLNPDMAMEWLLNHTGDPDIDEPLTQLQMVQVTANLGLMYVPPHIQPEIEHAIANNICTFTVTNTHYMAQKYYHCFTCNLIEGKGCCVSCARVCHVGHRLSSPISSESFFCDCGSGDAPQSCRALHPQQQTNQQQPSVSTTSATSPSTTATLSTTATAATTTTNNISDSTSTATSSTTQTTASTSQMEIEKKESKTVTKMQVSKRKKVPLLPNHYYVFDLLNHRDYVRMEEYELEHIIQNLTSSISESQEKNMMNGWSSSETEVLSNLITLIQNFLSNPHQRPAPVISAHFELIDKLIRYPDIDLLTVVELIALLLLHPDIIRVFAKKFESKEVNIVDIIFSLAEKFEKSRVHDMMGMLFCCLINLCSWPDPDIRPLIYANVSKLFGGYDIMALSKMESRRMLLHFLNNYALLVTSEKHLLIQSEKGTELIMLLVYPLLLQLAQILKIENEIELQREALSILLVLLVKLEGSRLLFIQIGGKSAVEILISINELTAFALAAFKLLS